MEQENESKIELRSEKTRRMIEDIPNRLVTWGITLILVIFLVLFTALYFIPYPYGEGGSILQHFL